jgi:hypothetical protein
VARAYLSINRRKKVKGFCPPSDRQWSLVQREYELVAVDLDDLHLN